jgi:hypothetical protein
MLYDDADDLVALRIEDRDRLTAFLQDHCTWLFKVCELVYKKSTTVQVRRLTYTPASPANHEAASCTLLIAGLHDS